ncbi:AbrB/MazE/SpoVT family DNA-binding domain-containing protein [Shigella flexneri]|uniref:AbrB/MazE/SpoVT family DNA-binding domain-containing protein n=1 Tax=Peribacillus frigoritolerans TaxID=450367 RepID=UPI0007BF15ED|nr:AbrB/MazE/SpoVT family DNA-binding domain-containing protein [Campylobacter jejuni]EFZ1983313.1 AbrB/MazE/SpoVT family DNA-binding domain-containing protein [Shigella flexneri]MCP1097189.1 AbrB/MazE/SpoVT family DNA-binding domain-containing protein [Bacillaceae bacterium OS4b]
MKKEGKNDEERENPNMAIIEAPIMIPNEPVELEGKIKLSSKGQIVIPVEVRRAAGIEEGGNELRYHFIDGKLILEVEKYLSADELLGFFDTDEDEGDFVLDLNQAREDRSIEILNKYL